MRHMGHASNPPGLTGLTDLTGLTVVLAGALLASCAGPQKPGASSEELPPLIDRALFFDDPAVSGGEISPDGTQIAFLRQHEGVRNIWVKGIDQSFDQARPVTADRETVFIYFWSWDSRYLCTSRTRAATRTFTSTPWIPRLRPIPPPGFPRRAISPPSKACAP
jgi:hypothetical protein